MLDVTVNLDFFSGIRDFMDFAKHSGIRVLRNERVTIAGAIVIVGVEDPTSDRFSEKGPDLDSALAGVNTKNPIILLNHRPARFDEAMKRGVDLQLSGHTHAGQLFPINFLIGLVYKYPYGFYKVGDSYIYTTSGSGLWGPTMRFLNRSEIVKFVLKKIPK